LLFYVRDLRGLNSG
jgi:hypothetical protein